MSDSEDEVAFESADEGDGEEEVVETAKIGKAEKKRTTSSSSTGKKSKSSKDVHADDTPSEPPEKPTTDPGKEKLDEENPDDSQEEKETPASEETCTNVEKVSDDHEKAAEADPPKQSSSTESAAAVVSKQPDMSSKVDLAKDEEDDKLRQHALDGLNKAADHAKPSWGGWGGWGSSLISTATSSVATFTSQVGEGFSTVLETVESSLGAPDPLQLAQQDRINRVKEPSEVPNGKSDCSQEDDVGDVDEAEDAVAEGSDEKKEDEEPAVASGSPGSGGWFGWGSITGITQTAGSLVTGGLDVLETIGKKTYDVIAEGDHGLKNTLKNTGNKVNLSQSLREAKDVYESQSKQKAEYEEARKAHFGSLFDEYNGLVHLEALEMVSNQSEGKVQSILGALPDEDVQIVKPELIGLRDVFQVEENEDDDEEVPDDHNFIGLTKEYTAEQALPLTTERLTQAQERARHWLKDADEEQHSGVKMSAKEIHRAAIQSLAELTACSVQHYHKMSQLLPLHPHRPITVFVSKSDALLKLCRLLHTEVDILSTRFTNCLTSTTESVDDPTTVNPLITNVYLEAGNSKMYIQEAFQLLLPVMQEALLITHTQDE